MRYFKHELLSRDNDKIFELIDAHGMQGYGIWWSVVEELYKAESNGFQIEATDTWFKRLSKALCLTDWRTLIRTLDTMAEHGLINSQLWAEHIILAPGIAERADDYMRQKELAAERKRSQRERQRLAKEEVSRVTPAGQGQSHAGVTTNVDPDPDPDPDPDQKRVYEPESESWRKYLDPSRELAAHTPLLTPWRIRDENQKLKNHKGFLDFLANQYKKPDTDGMPMAAGFLRNAQKDPGKNESALELWEHYLKQCGTSIAGVGANDVYELQEQPDGSRIGVRVNHG